MFIVKHDNDDNKYINIITYVTEGTSAQHIYKTHISESNKNLGTLI